MRLFMRGYGVCQERILRRRFFSVYFSACVIGCEERGVKNCEWQKSKKEQQQTEAQPDSA
jgi:hypothetical protein